MASPRAILFNLFLLLIVSVSGLFALEQKPLRVNIIDRPYRTISIIPLINLTKNKDYNFLSRDLAVFILSEIKTLGSVVLNTNEVEKPSHLDPKREYDFYYPGNLRRLLMVSESDWITNGDASHLQESDFIIKGYFKKSLSKLEEEKWIFTLSLSNIITHSVRITYSETFPFKRVLDYQSELTEKLKRNLNGGRGAVLDLTCSEERTDVYWNNKYVGYAPFKLFLSLPTNRIVLKKDGFKDLEKVYYLLSDDVQALSFNAEMEKDSATKKISVSTDPIGQRVYLNEQFIGLSPINNYSTFSSKGIVFVTGSNYQSSFVREDFNRKSMFHLTMKKENGSVPFFSNRRIAWGSFWMGSAILTGSLYYFMDSGHYTKLATLRDPADGRWLSDKQRSEASYSTGLLISLCSIPFFTTTLYFSARMSDEKDW